MNTGEMDIPKTICRSVDKACKLSPSDSRDLLIYAISIKIVDSGFQMTRVYI